MLQILEALEDSATNLETQANKLDGVLPAKSERLVGMQGDWEFKVILSCTRSSRAAQVTGEAVSKQTRENKEREARGS